MSIGNESAFPEVKSEQNGDATLAYVYSEGGLSKRELIAAVAMQGLLSSGVAAIRQQPSEELAEYAVRNADALLAELSKPRRRRE